jgi:hypothetical protein
MPVLKGSPLELPEQAQVGFLGAARCLKTHFSLTAHPAFTAEAAWRAGFGSRGRRSGTLNALHGPASQA